MYLDFARDMKKKKKQINCETLTVITIILGALGTVSKGMEKRLELLEIRRIDTIQTSALIRFAGILKRVLDTRGHLQSQRL